MTEVNEIPTNAILTMPYSKIVMRIEHDHIWVDPEVEVTETAQQVLKIMESHIVNMVERAVEGMKIRKDEAYEERNKLVALLASMFPSGRKKTDIPGWADDWHGCVFIDFPWGQASWHYHDSQAWMFEHLPPYLGEWDGHLTSEKYDAIMKQATNPQVMSADKVVEKMGIKGYGTLAIAAALRTGVMPDSLPDLTQDPSPAAMRRQANRPWSDPGY